METRCNEELCQLTWTASVDRCSTLYQRKEASWRLYVSCDRSWPPLCSEEASSASLAPLAKARCHYTPITGRFFLTGFIQVYVDMLFLIPHTNSSNSSFMIVALVFTKMLLINDSDATNA